MQLNVAHVLMADPEGIHLVRLKPSKGGPFEICYHRRLFFL
jgi:hypothetical protein